MSDRERVSDERLREVAALAASPFNYHGAADEPSAIAAELLDARDRIARMQQVVEAGADLVVDSRDTSDPRWSYVMTSQLDGLHASLIGLSDHVASTVPARAILTGDDGGR